jgi:predicted 2-oxoglutarate/Fe(II)-dependent dioxygenase YbiX
MEIFKSKSIQTISRLFHENYVFLEFWDLVHWPLGMKMGSHADNIYPDRSPNTSPNRDYSSICYLNHNYKGGHTFFVYENKTCIPEKGKIIFYPSGLQFTHGVSQVVEGDRYTLASWYTKNKNYILV